MKQSSQKVKISSNDIANFATGDTDEAVQKLARANQNIESLQKVLKTASYKNDSILADTVKATAKALEEVRHGIFGKKETKGYFEQPETWSNQWGGSLWQLASSKRAWESNEQNLFNHLKNYLSEKSKQKLNRIFFQTLNLLLFQLVKLSSIS